MTGMDWEQLKEQGNDAFKANLYDDAIKYYSEAISLNLSEPVLYSNRSAAYLKKGNYDAAADDARKAIELDNAFVRAYPRLHTALCSVGKFQEAAQAVKMGLSSISVAADVKRLRELQRSAEDTAQALEESKSCIAAGELDNAIRLLGEPLRLFPDCPQIVFPYAEATAPSEPDQANKLLVPFTSSHSSDPYYLYLRSLALYYRGQEGFTSAQNILKQTLELDPDNGHARVLLKKIRMVERYKEEGNTAFKAKRSAEAVAAYSAAIDADPTNNRMNATLRGNCAAARMDLKDFKAALLDCDYAISHGSASAKMYARRSRIQEHLENYEDAVRDLQHAAEEDRSFEAELRQLKVRAKKAKRKDYYKTLDLPKGESDEATIKRAYKKGCLQWHPDKWAHASEEEKVHAERQFKEVGEAFAVLSDPTKKRLYDSGQLDNDVEGANMGGMGGMGGMGNNEDFINVMNMVFGGSGGGFVFQQQQGFSGGFPAQGYRGGGGQQRQRRANTGGFYRA